MATVNLLLIGRTGNGKSSTGNSILGNKIFKARGSSTPTIHDIILDTATIDGQTVTVVDGPSFGDDSLDTPQHVLSTLKMAEKTMSLGSRGFSAVVIVLKYGIRYTKQESDVINAIKSFFGKDVVKKYGVIVWTHGDSFELDTEDEDTSFEAWCRDQTGNIADLLQECEYRCVLFNNRSKDEDKVKAQYSSLMDMVDKIQAGPYTEDNFRRAEPDRRAILVRSKLPQLESEKKELLDRFSSYLEQLDSDGRQRDSGAMLEELQKMKEELKERRRDLEREDGGTNVLNSLLLELQITETNVDAKMRSRPLLRVTVPQSRVTQSEPGSPTRTLDGNIYSALDSSNAREPTCCDQILDCLVVCWRGFRHICTQIWLWCSKQCCDDDDDDDNQVV